MYELMNEGELQIASSALPRMQCAGVAKYADAVKASACVMRINCIDVEPAVLVLEVMMHNGTLVCTSIFEMPTPQHVLAAQVGDEHPTWYEIAVVAPAPVMPVTMPAHTHTTHRWTA